MTGDEHYILVVDDDEAVREAICDALSFEGYTVRGARHGQEALELLRRHPRACMVFLDLMMPVMDGWEFRARQRSEPALADIPVCVVSAAGPTRAVDIDGARFLPKPFAVDALLDAASDFC